MESFRWMLFAGHNLRPVHQLAESITAILSRFLPRQNDLAQLGKRYVAIDWQRTLIAQLRQVGWRRLRPD